MSSPLTQSPPVIVASPAGTFWVKRREAHSSNYAKRIRARTRWIVLHATDGHEGTKKDDDVAAMFGGILAKPRSSTYVVDSNSVTQCVNPDFVAYHCGHTANAQSEGVELCGFAKQTRAEWLDVMSLPMLQRAARLVAFRCAARGLPPIYRDAEALRAGLPGITTHAQVSLAWGETKHTDPGPHFPLADFIEAVRVAMT